MTPLGEKLIARISAAGPMTVAEYMAACLGDPADGYYMRREPFGRDGDFVTAPEVSQMFGELIGLWAVATWTAMGAPSPFVLAELGPGRGTLMADLLRAARVRPGFLDAAEVHLVETSPRLKEAQAETLAAAGLPIAWHTHVDDLPAAPLILVANEFFDALPIRQFVRTAGGWAERMVGIGADGGLAFGLRATTPPGVRQDGRRRAPAPLPGEEAPAPASGDRIGEVCPAATAIMETVASRIAADGGAALVVDYGYRGPAFGDTLQAVRAHRYDDPLAAPGEADLTAHVDFAALAEVASAARCRPRPLIGQGDFLRRIGLAERAARLRQGKDEATVATIAAAAERLSGPRAMGDLFKVLAVSNAGLALPAFDGDPPIRGS